MTYDLHTRAHAYVIVKCDVFCIARNKIWLIAAVITHGFENMVFFQIFSMHA